MATPPIEELLPIAVGDPRLSDLEDWGGSCATP